MRRWAGAILFGLIGCTADRPILPWPPGAEAQSAIFVARAGSALALYAAEVAPPYRILPPFEVDREAELELLLYAEPLSELGLPGGEVRPEPSGLPVPTPTRTFLSRLDDGAAAEWQEGAPSAEVLGLKVARDPGSLCAELYRTQTLETGATRDVAFALDLGEQQALVASIDGTVVYVDGATTHAVRYPEGLPFGAAVEDEAGGLWFGGEHGELWRGAFRTEPEPTIEATWVATSSSGHQIRWLLLGPGPGREVFALSDRGDFDRYDGVEFQRIKRGVGTMETGRGGVVMPEPGVIYFGHASEVEVYRYTSGGRVQVVTPAGLGDGITGVGYVEGYGVMVAAGQGRIFQERAVGEWRELSDPSISLFIYNFRPFPDGFLIGGALGYVAQYRSATDSFCPATQAVAGSPRAILDHGDGFLVAEDVPISRDRGIIELLSVR